MNSTFGRGFSQGFKNNFNKRNFSSFFKNSYNNKSVFNLLNSNINSQVFKMQLANKCFTSKAIFLSNHSNLINMGSKLLSGECKNGLELEKLENEDSTKVGDGLTQLQGLNLIQHGKVIFNIEREILEHLDPVANWQMHDCSDIRKVYLRYNLIII